VVGPGPDGADALHPARVVLAAGSLSLGGLATGRAERRGGAGGLYLTLGDLAEALLLLVCSVLSVGIAVAQEAQTECALDALRDLASPRALVVRDGVRQRIAGRDVPQGDPTG
jgi:magnesium-transporting ATPase (P-type)